MIPTCSSDSTRRRRSKTATCVAGSSEVDRGRPAPESRISVPVSARAKSTPVTPELGAGRLARGGASARRLVLIARSAPRRPRAPRRRARAQVEAERRRVPGHHAPAPTSRARWRATAPGTSASVGDPVEHPGHPLELLAEALERLRPALGHLAPHGLRGLGRSRRAGARSGASKRPGVLPTSRRIRLEKLRARGHHAQILPALAEGPRGDRRQVARGRPLAEEERQARAAVPLAHERPLQPARPTRADSRNAGSAT